MTQKVQSAALTFLQKALGLAGGGAQSTDLHDESVQLVQDVGQIASAALPGTQDRGFFVISMSHSHAGAGTLADQVDPYLGANRSSDLSLSIPQDFDIWIHSVGVLSSTAAFSGASCALTLASAQTLFIFDGGTVNFLIPLGAWIGTDMVDNGNSEFYPNSANDHQFAPFRLPRQAMTGAGLVTRSEATGACVMQFNLMCEFVAPGQRPSTF